MFDGFVRHMSRVIRYQRTKNLQPYDDQEFERNVRYVIGKYPGLPFMALSVSKRYLERHGLWEGGANGS